MMLLKKWRASLKAKREAKRMEEAKTRAEWKEYCDAGIAAVIEAPTPFDKVQIMRSVYRAAPPIACSIIHGNKCWVRLFLQLKPTIEEMKNQTMDTQS